MANDIVIRKPAHTEYTAPPAAQASDRPIVPGARRLTAMEMNCYHFADRPTVLTPDRLRKAGK